MKLRPLFSLLSRFDDDATQSLSFDELFELLDACGASFGSDAEFERVACAMDADGDNRINFQAIDSATSQ